MWRAAAVAVAAAIACAAPVRAQAGSGPFNFLDNLFTGSFGKAETQPMRLRSPSPACQGNGAARTAPPVIH